MNSDGVPRPEFIEKSDAKLTAYGGATIGQLSKVTVSCSYIGVKTMADFYLSDAVGPDALMLTS